MGWSVADACFYLGITPHVWYNVTSRDQDVPRQMGLACAALYHRFDEWEIPATRPPQKSKRRMSPASLANLKSGGGFKRRASKQG